jgi:hypothetical protein
LWFDNLVVVNGGSPAGRVARGGMMILTYFFSPSSL